VPLPWHVWVPGVQLPAQFAQMFAGSHDCATVALPMQEPGLH